MLTRFSIAGLMGLVLAFALGFVGLKEASPFWASAIFTVAVGVLVLGVLNAVQGRDRARAFWAGFAISGWAYLICVFGIGSENGTHAPPLLIDLLMNHAQPLFHPQANAIAFVQPPSPGLPAAYTAFLPATNATPLTTPGSPPAPASPAWATNNVLPTTSITWSPLPTMPPAPAAPFLFSFDTKYYPFRQVGHSLAALLVAYLGGVYSLVAAARRDRRRDERTASVSPSSP